MGLHLLAIMQKFQMNGNNKGENMTTQVSLGITAKKMTKEEMEKRLSELRAQTDSAGNSVQEKKEGEKSDDTGK